MKCPKCQHDNPNGAKFCMECGAKLDNLCPKCGAKLPPEAKFCMECGTKIAESVPVVPTLEEVHTQSQNWIPDALAQKYLTAEQQLTGENRPITALFADISGFTPLSATQSSESIFQLVQECFKQLVSIVADYEGSISGFRGDGLLALFGAPILHENDAERAILAAIDMRKMMEDRGLGVSIGINTAMMTVGEIQTQLHSEYTAYGTDINLAKRLQEAAKSGQILVGSGTHRLTHRAFDFDTIPDLMVKGFSQSVTAYLLDKPKPHPEKLRGIEGLRARMIGREREFTDIKESADNLISGKGSVATVIGEAGLGKSRLALELKEYIKDKEIQWYEGRCLSIGQTISYWAFLDMLRSYLNLSDTDTDTETQIAEKIRESISNLFPQRQDDYLPFLGNLLSVKFGDELDNKLRYFTPEQIRHQTLMRLKDIFVAISHTKPLLLILEDLHWADDLSLDLIVLLMDELTANPLMLLCIYRPEQEHRCWQLGGMAFRKCPDRYTEITLKKLSQTQSRQLVESLLEIDNLPENTKSMILTKSEGNPFFIEELIRSLIDMELIYHEGDRWKARKEIEGIDVPDTIQSVLLSRVDRLNAETKYVLQCASVIGRLFRYRLLDHIARHERNLEAHLTELESKDLINAERTVPELEYAFKHALTQEATYQSILERKRREFHLQVAQGIEQLYSGRLEEYYEELAEHYSRSDEEKALEYLIKAGDKSKAIYANQQAIDYYTRAMNIANQFPEGKIEQKLSILEGLGDVYSLIGKWDEALQSYENAINYSKNNRKRADIYNKVANLYGSKYQPAQVLKYIDIAMDEIGEDTQSVEMARIYNTALWMYWSPPWPDHDFNKALDYGFKSLSILEGTEYKRELAETYMTMGQVYSYMNNHDKAIQNAQIALKIGQEMNNTDLLASVHFYFGFIYQRIGKWEIVLEHLEKSIELCKKAGNIPGVIGVYHWLAWSYYNKGNEYDSVIKYCKAGIELDKEKKVALITGHMFTIISMAYSAKGEWDEAIKYAEDAFSMGTAFGRNDSFMSSNACKVLIEAYQAKGELDKAFYYTKKSMNLFIDLSNSSTANEHLFFIEDIYEKTGNHVEFALSCKEIMEKNPEKLKKIALNQWYLEPKELSGKFTQTVFSDEFDGSLCPQWQWIDPNGNCRYELNKASWLRIQADSACNLWSLHNLDAPRLLQWISGDLAIESQIATDEEIPTVGGLLVWHNKNNFIRFEKGMRGKNNIELSGNVNGMGDFFGRGMLVSDTIYMRIERIGDILYAYSSKDGGNWLTCGQVEFPVGDPIQVGVHAIGNIGAQKGNMLDMPTATRFGYFRILKSESQNGKL